jgi:sulfur relay (sulfurtransferase) DsrF/TusC family protein
MKERKLTLALMDPPYESANSTTALRIITAALKRGIHINVFAYEGAVCLPLKDQAPHANPVKGTTVEQEEHPTTKAFPVRQDLEVRGISSEDCIATVQMIERRDIAGLFDDYEQVWHW